MTIDISLVQIASGLGWFFAAYFLLWLEARFIGVLDRTRARRAAIQQAAAERLELLARHDKLTAQYVQLLQDERAIEREQAREAARQRVRDSARSRSRSRTIPPEALDADGFPLTQELDEIYADVDH